MQTLTGQYHQLYSYKYRVSYTDFQPEVSRQKLLQVLTLPRTVEVVSVKLWLRNSFVAAGGPVITIQVHDDQSLIPSPTAVKAYMVAYVQQPSGNTAGNCTWVSNRPNGGAVADGGIIGNMVQSYNIYLLLTMSAGFSIDNITAGEFDIWLTTIKRP